MLEVEAQDNVHCFDTLAFAPLIPTCPKVLM